MAAICRNSVGQILQACTHKTAGNLPIKGEARAARLACHIAASYSKPEIIIEGDCLNLRIKWEIVAPFRIGI